MVNEEFEINGLHVIKC